MIAVRGPEFSSQQQHMTSWRLTSPATWMFVKKLFQANKVIITIFAKWLAFCMGIYRWPMNSHHTLTGTVMRKTISLHNVIQQKSWRLKSLATWLFAQQFGSGVCHNPFKTKSRFVRACTGERGNASLMVGFPPQRDSDAGKIFCMTSSWEHKWNKTRYPTLRNTSKITEHIISPRFDILHYNGV